MIRTVGKKWAVGVIAITVTVGLAGCSGQQPSAAEVSASASPSASAAAVQVNYGADRIKVDVGQRVNFQTPGEALWTATSSHGAVFKVIEPTEDFFTPETPGGIAQSPGIATVTMTQPDKGGKWTVKVRVIDPNPSPSTDGR